MCYFYAFDKGFTTLGIDSQLSFERYRRFFAIQDFADFNKYSNEFSNVKLLQYCFKKMEVTVNIFIAKHLDFDEQQGMNTHTVS